MQFGINIDRCVMNIYAVIRSEYSNEEGKAHTLKKCKSVWFERK
jgi:hypothetical protein